MDKTDNSNVEDSEFVVLLFSLNGKYRLLNKDVWVEEAAEQQHQYH